jgi:hypothetical protein
VACLPFAPFPLCFFPFVEPTPFPHLLFWTMERESKKKEMWYCICYCVLCSFICLHCFNGFTLCVESYKCICVFGDLHGCKWKLYIYVVTFMLTQCVYQKPYTHAWH